MDHSRSHRCVIPLVVIEDAAKSTRGDFRTMVDHNVERLVGAIERSKYGSHVRLLTVHYHDEIAVKRQFAPLRDIRPGALELADCRGTAATGKAILFALDEVKRQYKQWEGEKTLHTRPIFLLLTDDRPVDCPAEQVQEMEADYQKAVRRVRSWEQEGELTMAGCALSQLRLIRCNKGKLQELCGKTFEVRQMPDGVEHMEEGFASVISWVEMAITDAWNDRPRPEERRPPRNDEGSDKRPEWAKEDSRMHDPAPGPAPDDPIRRFMGILNEREDAS